MGDENTLMDDLAEAWDEATEEEESTDEVQPEVPEVAAVPDEGSEEAGDPTDNPDPVQEDSEQPDPGEIAVEDDKPPVGLSPAAREAWKDTPKSVRDEIAKREKDYEAGIVKYAENAKRAEQMDKSLAPYSQLFAMNGGPGNVLPGLLQTASMLQMGSPTQRAETVANLIKQFGVDIKTLDNLLVGKAAPQDPNQDVANIVDQRMQAWQQQQTQQYEQQQQQRIAGEIQAFATDPKNEFYNDVRDDMAVIMEADSAKGVETDLKTAYDRACMMNPQIRDILLARQANQTISNKRQAAASVTGSPGGPGDTTGPDGLRASLEHAWENAGRT